MINDIDIQDIKIDKSEMGRRSYEEGYSFEERVSELYRLLRYDVENGRLFSGRQVDLFLTGHFGDLTVYRAIECKNGTVKADHIDSFVAKLRLVRREYPSALGTIVSAVSFTDAVASQAAQEGIQLTLYRDLSAQLFDGHAYVNNLKRECDSNERYPMQLYIEPNIGYELTGPHSLAFGIVDEWLNDSDWNQLTLLGDVGTGKSFLSRMLAYRLASKFLDNPLENPVPILIDLRNADRQFSIEGLVLTHLTQNGLSRISFEAFQHALIQGNIVLILDGFDEMASRVTPQITNRNFQELASCVKGRAKVLLTCRTHYFKSRTEEEEVILGGSKDFGSETVRDLYWELISRKGFRIGYIRPFEIAQIEEYVSRCKGKHANDALHRIRNTYNLMELSQRPMLLEMIVKSIDKLTSTEINPATLYMVYTDAWIHRDQWREVLSPEIKLTFLMRLTYSLWHEDVTSIHYTHLIDYLQQRLGAQIQNPQHLIEFDLEIRTATFLTRDDSGNYGFAHKSYAEYFLARYLANELNNKKIDCIHCRRLTPEVINFLRYMIDLNIIEPILENILINEYRSLTSENALLCLYNIRKEIFLSKINLSTDKSDVKLEVQLPKKMKLSGAQLDQMNLEGAILFEADLSDANLMQTILVGVDLSYGNLQNSNLEKADLTRANLSVVNAINTDFTAANLEKVNLNNANLEKANLKDTSLIGAIHQDVNIHDAIFTRALLPDSMTNITGRASEGSLVDAEMLLNRGFLNKKQELIKKLYPHVIKAARSIGVKYDLDEHEIVQEAIINISKARNLEDIGEDEQLRYIRVIVNNTADDLRHKGSKEYSFSEFSKLDSEIDHIYEYLKSLPSSEQNALDMLMEDEITRHISKLEHVLSPLFWRILKGRYWEELTFNEIAKSEGISLSTVHRYHSKALEIAHNHLR